MIENWKSHPISSIFGLSKRATDLTYSFRNVISNFGAISNISAITACYLYLFINHDALMVLSMLENYEI